MKQQFLEAKCKDLVCGYMEIMKYIVDRQIQDYNIETIGGDTDESIMRDFYIKKGQIQGMRRLLYIINKEANGTKKV